MNTKIKIDEVVSPNESRAFSLDDNILILEKSTHSVNNLDEKISKIMHDIGLQTNFIGYRYIKDILFLVVESGKKINYFSEVYPEIAKRFNSTPSRIERAVRYSIEQAWLRDTMSKEISDWFAFVIKAKPTNSEFISTITDKLLNEYSVDKHLEIHTSKVINIYDIINIKNCFYKPDEVSNLEIPKKLGTKNVYKLFKAR